MKKKIILLVSLLIFIAGFTYYINSDTFNGKVENINPFLAIPTRTAAYVSTKNIEKLNHKIDSLSYLEKLNKSKLFIDFKNQLSFLDTFKTSFSKNNIHYNKVILCLNNTGSNNLGFLSIVETQQLATPKQIKELFKNNGIHLKEYKYQSRKIFTAENNIKISFSIFENLLLISNNTPLLEESLNSLLNNKSKSGSQKMNVIAKNSNSDIDVFIDNRSVSDIETTIFNNIFLEQTTSSNIDWQYSSVVFGEKSLKLKTNYFYKKEFQREAIKNNTPVSFSLDHFLPNNIAYFEAYTSKNNTAFISNDVSYQYFKTWLDEEVAFFCLETFDEDYLKKSGLVLKAKNIDSAKVSMYLLNKEMIPIDKYESLAIYKMNVDVLSKHFKSNIISFEKPVFAFIGKYVVFANDISVIRTCYQKYKTNHFLKADLQFQEFIKNKELSDKILYLNPQKWSSTINHIFNEPFAFSSFGKTKIKTFNTDSSIYSIGEVSFDIENIQKTTKLWQFSMDTFSDFKAQIVVNANNQRKEVFTQDNSNKIYLISQSGDIIFKKKIKEKIMGDVFQIDFYKSKKLQYAFNTKNYIYLIDRKGRIVDGFPLKLPAAASNSLLVVNYDNAKKYRYFIACKNGSIYGYEANGKPLKAWSPLGSYGYVHTKIKHSIFNGKDYLYFNNSEGSFYAFNRKGEQRFDAVNLSSKFVKPFEKTKNGFINFGKGSVYKIDLKGKTTVKILGDSTYTIFENFSEKDAYAIASKNEFRIAKSKWTILGKKKLNDKIIAIEKVNTKEQTWFLVQGEKSVYLINELGEIHPDFPMLTNSEAVIENFIVNKSEILLLTEDNNLKAFELSFPD